MIRNLFLRSDFVVKYVNIKRKQRTRDSLIYITYHIDSF